MKPWKLYNGVRLSPYLEHLSEAQINKLIVDYKSGKSIEDIVKENDISYAPTKLWEILPPTKLDKSCRHCGAVMLSKVRRTAVTAAVCISCGHGEEPDKRGKCYCRNCITELMNR